MEQDSNGRLFYRDEHGRRVYPAAGVTITGGTGWGWTPPKDEVVWDHEKNHDDMGTYVSNKMFENAKEQYLEKKKQLKIAIFGAASDKISKKKKKLGFAVGKLMAENDHIMLFGAGSTGMMGAVARGYISVKNQLKPFGSTTGYIQDLEPQFPPGQIHRIMSETMSDRKELYYLADIMIIMPGGIGTLDELFEFMVMKKLDQWHGKIYIWGEGWISDLLRKLVDQMDIQKLADRPKELVEFIDYKRLKELLE